MDDSDRHPLLRYGCAVVSVAVMTWLRLSLSAGPRQRFVLFYLAVIFTSWYTGFGPSVLAIVLACLSATYFLLTPLHTWRIADGNDLIAMGLFVVVCSVIVAYSESARAVRRRLEWQVGERRRAEQAEREQRQRYQAILASVGDGVVVADARGCVVSLNPVAERLTGWASGEAAGRPLKEVFRAVDRETPDTAEMPVARSVPGRIVRQMDASELVTRGGTSLPIEYCSAAIEDERGAVTGVVISFRDITGRKRAEEALRASEEQYRAVYSQAATGIGEADLSGRIVRANDRYCEIVGYPREELLGMRIAEITHPEDRADDRSLFEGLIDGGPAYTVEKRYVRKDGSTVWVRVAVSRIEDGSGRPARAAAVIEDITDRKRSEEALRDQAERLRLALDSARMGTWEWDLGTDRVEWSDNLEEIHGLPRGGFDGTLAGFRRLIHPEDRGRVERAIADSIEQGSAYEVEFRNVWPDGSIHWMSGRGKVFTDRGGRPIRMTGTAMDVTDRKVAEESLREADRRKEEFLAVLSHELRNPLAPIQTSLDLMRRSGLTTAEFEHERSVVEHQVRHLTRLVDDLLDVSRISRGRIELQTRVLVLSEAIAEAVEAVKSRIDERHQELDVSLPEGSVRLEADPTRLGQILLNLLANAAKFTDIGGRIGLTAERDEDEVVVRVRDTGIGIAPEMLPRIFDLFVQGDRRLDQARGGMGIGLSLVKDLVEKHGGSITARSEGPGMGSEFVVRLPMLTGEQEVESDRRPARSDVPEVVPRRRILIVDDNAVAADGLGRLLGLAFGQEVRVAYDGTSALEMAVTFRPEIVLLDLGMAAMDGYEVALRLRERPGGAGLRIIAVTGWGQEEDRRRTREMGFDLHLVKPVNLSKLKALLADPDPGIAGDGPLEVISGVHHP